MGPAVAPALVEVLNTRDHERIRVWGDGLFQMFQVQPGWVDLSGFRNISWTGAHVVEARTHLEAMMAVRPIRRVRVASKSIRRARAYAERESRHGIPIEACATERFPPVMPSSARARNSSGMLLMTMPVAKSA